jgi:hypothetical protein
LRSLSSPPPAHRDQGTPPLGGLVAGFLLADGAILPAILTAATVMGLPGAIGAIHPALGRDPTEPVLPKSTAEA